MYARPITDDRWESDLPPHRIDSKPDRVTNNIEVHSTALRGKKLEAMPKGWICRLRMCNDVPEGHRTLLRQVLFPFDKLSVVERSC